MNFLRSIISRRNAFASVDSTDALTPITQEQREQIQNILLEIYKDILEVCNDYHLVPFLAGGCALGAVRHGGFIPWDDDLDIAMMRGQYDEFLEVFAEKYQGKYIVNAPGVSSNPKERFAKIIKKGTLFKELITVSDDKLNGIFVDIFPIENIPDNTVHMRIKGTICNVAEFIGSQVFFKEYITPESKALLIQTGKLNYTVRMIVGTVFGIRKSEWWFEFINRIGRYNDSNTMRCASVYGRKHYFGEILKRSQIWPPRYIEFCGVRVPVFNDLEGYLTMMYGNYMKIPPVEKREVHMIREIEI